MSRAAGCLFPMWTSSQPASHANRDRHCLVAGHRTLGCVQAGDVDTETGYTFAGTFSYIQLTKPLWFLFQNVKQLAEFGFEQALASSDASWICEQLAGLGYEVEVFLFDCVDYCSIANRCRLYFVGWRLDAGVEKILSKGDVRSELQWWKRILNNITIPHLPAEDFFVFDGDSLVKIVQRTSSVVPCDASGGKEKWREDHCEAFRALALEWPPELPTAPFAFREMGPFMFMRGGLSDRQAELAFFLMVRFPFLGHHLTEFIDVNTSLGRLLQNGDNSPWRPTLPTVTGSARPVIRYRAKGSIVVRPVFGFEAFQVMGWSLQDWAPMDELPLDNFLTNLVGNSFSGFALLPMYMVLSGVQACISQQSRKAGLEVADVDAEEDDDTAGPSDSDI